MKKMCFGVGLHPWKNDDDYIIRYAVDHGIYTIDTAENYGISESLVGKAIRGIRNKVEISTKLSPEHSRRLDVITSLEKSLRKMNIDYVDIYNIHWPNYEVEFEETYMALKDLQSQGKIRKIGLCNINNHEIDIFLKFGSIDAVQMEFNLLERWSSSIAEKCNRNNIEFFAYSSLDHGIICDSQVNKAVIQSLSSKYEVCSAAIVLSWICSTNKIPIFTSLKTNHIKENLKGLDINFEQNDINILNGMGAKIEDIDINKIIIVDGGHHNRTTYKNLEDAIKNELGYCPSPVLLSQQLLQGGDIKPIKLNHKENNYTLIEGRARYWAWRIAYGSERPIPAIIRETII